MTLRSAGSLLSCRAARGAGCAALLLSFLGGAAAADDLVVLKPDQAAIIFVVDGQGRGGDLQVRSAPDAAPLWASVVSRTSVCQFTVRPGRYTLILAPDQKPIALSAAAGRATIVSLIGQTASGAYRWRAQDEVVPGDIEKTPLPGFIDENRIAPAGYAPTPLEQRGDGLTFVFRTDF